MNQTDELLKRYAFISYNHRDIKTARWLHKKLESYKLPNEIHNEFEDTKYLRPVFRDQADINTGVLNDVLKEELKTSKYLIVICSPNSSKSKWVSNEVKYFVEWGRMDRIIPFIIDGTPYAGGSEECFPEFLLNYISENPEKEILGVNAHEVGKEKALIRVASRMLGIEFDVLWKRHEREKRRKRIINFVLSIIILCAIYLFAMPISLDIEIKDEAHALPPIEQATITVDGNEHTFHSLDTIITFNSIPGYKRITNLEYTINSICRYTEESGTIKLGLPLKQKQSLTMHRNDDFAIFAGTVYNSDGEPLEGAKVEIEDKFATTNAMGGFRILFDIEQQTATKCVRVSKEGYISKERQDEIPGKNICYILHK